ncbi:metallophosphoesterase family protein [Tichowtungia aerotolerans]|uniref:Calcineurin-like phosphoesterase domain-containing protein n=1 Tax=Tichowtungia aerotolerans TaxID=2697043 RepID=A0A6P1M2D8_9BACT|nr:metallophosphoesterase [Tichowtungia aerotolerans]QHI68011.1 hypothetical protein GT409_00615 [Tichowtungia aerotolerans]
MSATSTLGIAPMIANALSKSPNVSGQGVLKGFIVSDAHFGWRNEQQPDPQRQRELITHIHERFPDLDLWLDTGDAHHSSLGAKAVFDAATTDWCDIIANQSNKALFYYVPGNHEICQPTAGQDSERRCARMGSMSYRPYYSFDVKGIHFVSVPELEHPVYINKETMDWLKLDLDLNRDKTVILLSHNNVKGTTHFDDTFMAGYRGVANSKTLLDVIEQHPNVIAWMHGHNHDYVVSRHNNRLFVSNGRIGGFNPHHAYEDGEPLGGIYFEVWPDRLVVQCYSAEHELFIDEGLGRKGRSQTLRVSTTVDPLAPTGYAFGHGGFLDGQRAAVHNYHTSKDSLCSLILAGTEDACINENIGFSDYTHRSDNPQYKQWDVFGFKVRHNGWPRYFEEKNDVWRWLNPGVLLLARESSEEVTSLNLPDPGFANVMYYRAVPGRPYECRLKVASKQGGEKLELRVRVCSQEGRGLWKTTLPVRSLESGEQTLVFPIEVPEIHDRKTIYGGGMLDSEIQLSIEARFRSLMNDLTIYEAAFYRADSEGATLNPELTFNGVPVGKAGSLGSGKTLTRSVAKPTDDRWLVEGSCEGSHRMLWYCRQTNIDWQVRNAPVADHGAYLEVGAPTNTWSTGNEVVIQPTATTRDAVFVHRLRQIDGARIWPLNRGNSQVSIEMLSGAETGTVEVCVQKRPADVRGAVSWSYENGVVQVQLAAGSRVTVVAG